MAESEKLGFIGSDIFKTMDGGVKSVWFIGVGGISMSSLAHASMKLGLKVGGSDRTASPLTQRLSEAGADVKIGHSAENVRGYDIVIYSVAIKPENPEREEAKKLGIPCFRRADYLGWLMTGYKNRIGIAGTHGKSTTTTLISLLFAAAGLDPTVECGAVIREFDSACRDGGQDFFIFEACEYTDSFLSFFPTTAVITNVDVDHLDYFSGIDQIVASFSKYLAKAGSAVINGSDANTLRAAKDYRGKIITFSLDGETDYRAENLTFDHGMPSFTITERSKKLCGVKMRVPGKHNVLNMLAATAAARLYGISPEVISSVAEKFTGCHRRFERCGVMDCGAVVYDDYAHHPSEIKAALSGAKSLGRDRIITIFQPHTYSRTAELYDSFTTAFADSDVTVFADIYAAREVNTYGVTSEKLASDVKNGVYVGDFDAIAEYVRKIARPGDLIITMGAGEADKIGRALLAK